LDEEQKDEAAAVGLSLRDREAALYLSEKPD